MRDLIVKNNIKDKIFIIRNTQVMIDRDLAELYGVPTKRLNEQVKRNIKRFPSGFMFQLSDFEKDELVAKCDRLKNLKHSSTNPYAFTEQGVSMLSAVLKSERAVEISIQIIDAFVSMRHFLANNAQIFQRLNITEMKLLEHSKSHDRFMIIDNKELYHFGASLKDLGKKWFAFSKFEKDALDILRKIRWMN